MSKRVTEISYHFDTSATSIKIGEIIESIAILLSYIPVEKLKWKDINTIIFRTNVFRDRVDMREPIISLINTDKSQMTQSEIEACGIISIFLTRICPLRFFDHYKRMPIIAETNGVTKELLQRFVEKFTIEDIKDYKTLKETCVPRVYGPALIYLYYIKLQLSLLDEGRIKNVDNVVHTVGMLLYHSFYREHSLDDLLIDTCNFLGNDILASGKKFLKKDELFESQYQHLYEFLTTEVARPFLNVFDIDNIPDTITESYVFCHCILPTLIWENGSHTFRHHAGYDKWKQSAYLVLLYYANNIVSSNPNDVDIKNLAAIVSCFSSNIYKIDHYVSSSSETSYKSIDESFDFVEGVHNYNDTSYHYRHILKLFLTTDIERDGKIIDKLLVYLDYQDRVLLIDEIAAENPSAANKLKEFVRLNPRYLSDELNDDIEKIIKKYIG